ncbi:cytochrome c [Gemmatimonas sp.]|uniref:c-type cytochrome n=1 Tax=Gemmatimonas sp. TaxID=1962908 RepID=UPI0025BCC810|nr:cytochrome c [Gemmatimonas sp.]MCA2992364.1 cytochrome c [Gemmatimonas sp.]
MRHASAAARAVAVAGLLFGSAMTACTDSAPEVAPADPTYGLGHAPAPAALAAIDIDVDPTGRGLPVGSGSVTSGAVVYAAQCASCHGTRGEGIAPSPALVGRTPDVGYDFSKGERAPRTIGNYWPYATTVFDYVRRAMPLSSPGSLTANETYGVVAWLLHQNGIIDSTAVMDAKSLPAVAMPARRIFVPDDRTGGPAFR